MLSSLPAVVGFFPPRPSRTGDVVVFCSFANALAKRVGALNVLFPKERVFPSLINPPESVRLVPASEATPPEISDEVATLMLPSSLSLLSKNVSLVRLRCLVGVSPTIEDVRHARDLRARLLALGLSHDQIRFVGWNQGLPGALAADVVEEEIGPAAATLPFDPGLLCRAENGACLLQDVNPRSSFVSRLDQLAGDVGDWMSAPFALSHTDFSDPVAWRAWENRIAAHLWTALLRPSARQLSVEEMGAQVDQALQTALLENAEGAVAPAHLAATRQRLLDHVTGLGPLEVLLRDTSVNEIMVNGVRDIFLERDGIIAKAITAFDTPEQLRIVIDRIVGRMGRRVDLSSPLCDARLPDGSRVNVVLPPLSLTGPLLTIRRFKTLYQSLDDLMNAGTLTEEQADQLRRAVDQRKNIIVAGNAGAGKTTLLNVLAGLIPSAERIITLEDAAELQIRQPHVVRLETRPANAEGMGRISMADLVVNALRMRPDRLVIGECRGAEVIPMLQAMNTGHDGSMTTIHANSAADARKRLESLVLLHAPEWSIDVVRDQVVAGIDLIVFLKRSGAARKILEIADV